MLTCIVRLDAKVILEGNRLFEEFKGALTEQYVLQQLKTMQGIDTYYWTNERGSAEIDFLLECGAKIIPVEVKAETNLHAKSLKTYREKFRPTLVVRTSLADYKCEDGLLNLPLYALETLEKEVERSI